MGVGGECGVVCWRGEKGKGRKKMGRGNKMRWKTIWKESVVRCTGKGTGGREGR